MKAYKSKAGASGGEKRKRKSWKVKTSLN